jgi:hypothetical protein
MMVWAVFIFVIPMCVIVFAYAKVINMCICIAYVKVIINLYGYY